MTTEAIDTATATNPNRTSPRPIGEAWDTLSDAEAPLDQLEALVGLLGHVASSDDVAREDELRFLANAMLAALFTTTRAVVGTLDRLRPLALAERIAAEAERNRPDPEAAEARARRMARVAVELWRERRAELRQHREAEAVA